jgi:hypothetical protein
LILGPDGALAHCDGLDGPVVTAARQALEKDDVTKVLIRVQREDEAEIRRAFERAVTVRKRSPEARDLADMYFFETLVRVHRAAQAAPYTGLKPAGRARSACLRGATDRLSSGAFVLSP